MAPNKSQLIIPTILFAVSWLFFFILGFRFEIPWSYYQLLDPIELQTRPWNSLILLHSQPPVLNSSLAIILQIAQTLSIQPEHLSHVLFIIGGLISTLLLFHLITQITHSQTLAILGTIFTLIDPSFHLFAHLFFYTYWLHILVIALFYVSYLFFIHQQPTTLYGLCILLAIICNTRTLYHPLWALCFLAITFFLILHLKQTPIEELFKTYTRPTILLILLLAAWPIKNHIVFNTLTYSTWSGFNLSHGTGATNPILRDFLENKKTPPSTQKAIDTFTKKKKITAPAVIQSPQKSDDSQNWNHYVFLQTQKDLSTRAIQWRLEHPWTWIKNSILFYFKWSQPSYIHPYNFTVQGPASKWYQKWASWHKKIFYFDLTPLINTLSPDTVSKSLQQNRIQINLFGLILFPIAILSFLHVLFLNIQKKDLPQTGIILLSLFCIAWVLGVSCLTDGAESNRMRFSTQVLFMLLILKSAQHYLIIDKLAVLKRLYQIQRNP